MDTEKKYDALKIENQICFPLYAASREIIKKYRPFLDEIDLTYTQYITMMVLWQEKCVSVKSLGEKLFLDSGTLSPVLKSLESKKLILKTRDDSDERSVNVSLTETGEKLKDKALQIPLKMAECAPIDGEDAAQLYKLLYKILGAARN